MYYDMPINLFLSSQAALFFHVLYMIADIDMTEQPQRPTRTLRVYDENSLPTAGTQKTLHQRNKSSPALSSMLHAGGLKLAAKRTAFGDVSNTTNVSRPSKDDSAIGGKVDFSMQEKPLQIQQDRKTASFLRPAQRPISVSGLKGLLNNVTTITSQQPSKQPLIESKQPSLPTNAVANTRKILTKKSTAVFKDIAPPSVDQPGLDVLKPLPPTAPAIPIHGELQVQPPLKQTEDVQQSQTELTRRRSKYAAAQETQNIAAAPSTEQASSDAAAVLRSDGIYIDDQGQVRLYEYTNDVERVNVVETATTENFATVAVQKNAVETDRENPLDARLAKCQPDPLTKSATSYVQEPEEYWDDEGEGNYDEDGYVTARSFKSRGENTTGGATTLLFPKVNQKARKEIAAAKDLIEGSKTAEDLEDEAWDTTMVAEYGEEIFQFMKDLEVVPALLWRLLSC